MSWWKKLLWMGISALGVWAIAVLALSRGEQISALWIVLAGFCALSISYRFYSKSLATKVLLLNEGRATPAVLQNDNKDYVPTNRWMVFGHHFAAIAGPGPLVGPVLAAQFGFLPGTLWILIGATLGGGVHDMIVLFASIRRGGKTLGQMVKEEVGRRGFARSHQRAGNHDYSAGCPCAGRGSGAGAKSLGRLHDCDDHSAGVDYGNRVAHGESKRRRGYH